MRPAYSTEATAGGSTISNVAPAPGVLVTTMSPPQRRTKFSDRNRPRPVPPFRRLKNGSKIRFWCSASMPQPLSEMRSRAGLPSTSESVTRPPALHACTALSDRLISACCSSDSSARTCTG